MDELYNKLVEYMQIIPAKTIGDVFSHFSSLGYAEKDIAKALRKFSDTHIAKTTEICD